MFRLLERARERRERILERRTLSQEIPKIEIPPEFRRIEVYPPRLGPTVRKFSEPAPSRRSSEGSSKNRSAGVRTF